MFHARAFALALGALAAFAAVAPTARAQCGPFVSTTRWIDPQNGDDTDPGSQACPWRSLTHALQTAAVTPAITTIKVVTTSTPITTFSLGGSEPNNAFPFVMLTNVTIEGVPSGGGKPVVELSGIYAWPAGVPHAFFVGASACSLANLRLDASGLRRKPCDNPVGVHAENVTAFDVVGCDVVEMFDGIRFRESVGATTTGSVVGCDITGCFPVGAACGADDGGHAGMWLEVVPQGGASGGAVDVAVLETRFANSHDAIETRGDNSNQTISLTLDRCLVECNENGLELVDKATQIVNVDCTRFSNNYNNDDGSQADDGLTGAIVTRNAGADSGGFTLTVRNSVFENNALGVVWNAASGSSLDLGNQANRDPGNNTFSLDWSLSPAPPYSVCLLQKSSDEIEAWGNTWLACNQRSTAAGCLQGVKSGTVTAPCVVCGEHCTSATGPCPAGPRALPGCPSTPIECPRNFAITSSSGRIDFGPDATRATPCEDVPAPQCAPTTWAPSTATTCPP